MEFPVPEPLPLRFDRAGLDRPTFRFARQLAISEPCAGMFSSHVSLREWGVDYKPVNVFDKIEGYRQLWTHFFGEGLVNQFRCGREGDLLQFPLAGLDYRDGLIGGPPCPPWAANGDARARTMFAAASASPPERSSDERNAHRHLGPAECAECAERLNNYQYQ